MSEHPAIETTIYDYVCVNGRISKKLFEKVIQPKLKELDSLRAELERVKAERDEAVEVVRFYGCLGSWGIAGPSEEVSIDPCDHEGNRGGKRAREFLAKIESANEKQSLR